MNTRTRIGLSILGAALVLGILGEALLRVTPWGPNAAIWIAALGLACFVVARRQAVPLEGGGRWLMLPVVVFAGALAWRDSTTLKIINLTTAVCLLALAVSRTREGRLRLA